MEVRAEVQRCITECEGAFTNLRSAAEQANDPRAKQKLEEAQKRLEECIRYCRDALNAV